ncbi:MAG: putative toxin-antitoxin system toxin component, PIN family [Gammaproteobacteria bacterium]|nr:putative toxin-antitoxin system toxin component, PIN family [Gammaproteobacteria bacterium]MDE0283747.1 putative toxin-antitoxin system toxin component, PIN family [Gammaproteobacteria bacterium]MDE0511057.1 putative toxin-antitoxin system toxin component, PIN family [Gammaproteobacteria bacterium]
MKVVLDCNVLVSAARVDGACRAVIDTVVRRHEIVLSEPILSEYNAVAGRRSQVPYQATLKFVIREFERLATLVEPENIMFGLRDPDDEVYLATAMAGGAILITGNTRDFTERRYGSVEVWSPRAFLDHTT